MCYTNSQFMVGNPFHMPHPFQGIENVFCTQTLHIMHPTITSSAGNMKHSQRQISRRRLYRDLLLTVENPLLTELLLTQLIVSVTHVDYDVEDEPERPVLTVVAAQECPEREQETPGQVHEDPVQVDEGEVVIWTAPGIPVLPRPRQQPQVTHHRVWITGEVCLLLLLLCVCVCVCGFVCELVKLWVSITERVWVVQHCPQKHETQTTEHS